MSDRDDANLLIRKAVDDGKGEAFTQSPSCFSTDYYGCHWVILNTPNSLLNFGREVFAELLCS
jgi:hypothetical protein